MCTIVSARDDEDIDAVSDVAMARSVGLAIIDNVKAYMTASEQCIEAFASSDTQAARDFAARRVRWDRKADSSQSVRSRFAPGLILDLPEINFDSSLGMISIRSCITVCSNGSRSKIWTRFVTADGGKVALSEQDLALFGEAAREICTDINAAIRRLYEFDFDKAAGISAKLEPFGNIHLFTVDCEGNGITDQLRAFSSDLQWASEKMTEVVDQEVADALRDVTSASSIPAAGRDQEPESRAFELADDASFFTHEASTHAPNLLVHHTTGTTSYFVGLIGTGGQARCASEQDAKAKYPSGVGTSGEIAGLIGSVF